ncbi:hypothetical protein [Ottowia sp. VDI28]|uniref:hypothetical protein n=1 Tax=Ottowia sp. VDI28 TaxID=3133968 RepID=UPI003C2BFA8B
MADASTFQIDVYRARVERYAAEVDRYRLVAEKAGYGKDHPLVQALMEQAKAESIDLPEAPTFEPPELPNLPVLAIPRIEIPDPSITAPEIPKV